jgi:hypothetical protein
MEISRRGQTFLEIRAFLRRHEKGSVVEQRKEKRDDIC